MGHAKNEEVRPIGVIVGARVVSARVTATATDESLSTASLSSHVCGLLDPAGVQARLGHASASETLDTYSHLWPDSNDRTREAVDAVLGNLADYLRTNHVPKQ